MLRLDRKTLAQFLPNPQAIATFEKLIEDVGSTLPDTIEAAQALASQAQTTAVLALAMLAETARALEIIATAPAPTPLTDADNHTPAMLPVIELDDHAPRAHLGTMAAQNHDSVAITGGTVGVDGGAVATPSLWFGQDSATGLYQTTAGRIAVSIAGTKLLELSDKLAALTGRAQIDAGAIATAALPALYFGTDTATGLYRFGADSIGLAVAGTLLAKFSGTTVDVTGSVRASQQLVSTVATGTAPLTVTSTTKVTNLNADLLDGNDWAAPGTIGATTPGIARFSDVTVTGNFGCNGKPSQGAVASGGAVSGTGATNVSPYGFSTAAQANDIITKLNTIQAALIANGIMS